MCKLCDNVVFIVARVAIWLCSERCPVVASVSALASACSCCDHSRLNLPTDPHSICQGLGLTLLSLLDSAMAGPYPCYMPQCTYPLAEARSILAVQAAVPCMHYKQHTAAWWQQQCRGCREVLQEARAAAAAATDKEAAPGSHAGGSDGGSDGADGGDGAVTPTGAAGALGILDYGRRSPPQHAQHAEPTTPASPSVAPASAGEGAGLSDAGLHGGNESARVHVHECQPDSGMLACALPPMPQPQHWRCPAASAQPSFVWHTAGLMPACSRCLQQTVPHRAKLRMHDSSSVCVAGGHMILAVSNGSVADVGSVISVSGGATCVQVSPVAASGERVRPQHLRLMSRTAHIATLQPPLAY